MKDSLGLPRPGPTLASRREISRHLTIADLIKLVCAELCLAPGELRGVSRLRPYARGRQIVMWLARVRLQRSYPFIGRELRRDHTSVLHGVRNVDNLRMVDAQFRAMTDRLARLVPSRATA